MANRSKVNLNWLDRVAGFVSPKWASNRLAWRAYHQEALAFTSSRSGGYRGATNSRLDKSTTSLAIGESGPDELTLARLRDRSRRLERDNVLGSSMLSRAVDNVVGSGMKLQATTPDPEFNKRAEELWRSWWHEQPESRGQFTGPQLERLVVRSRNRDGDVGAILLKSGQIQMVEGDQVATPLNRKFDRQRMIDGVEVNAAGRAVRYWIASAKGPGRVEYTPVPAKDFIFLPRLQRLNQVRGAPVFTNAFGLFDQLDGYIEATVVAARMSAMFGLVIEKNNPANTLNKLTPPNSSDTQRKEMKLEPGLIQFLENGESISQINPAHPSTAFESMVTAIVRLLGLELGMPLELSMLDFSRTNYSSARASLMQAYRAFRTEQDVVKRSFLGRIYRWKVSKWLNDGLLDPPADGAEPWGHRFMAEPWQFLDPVKELQGKLGSVDAGLSTVSWGLMEQGLEFDDWLAVRSRELEEMRDKGVPVLRSSLTSELKTPGNPNTRGDA